MKKSIRYTTIVLAVVILAAVAWRGGAWLLGTPEGARRVLESLSRHTPVKVSVRKIEGRLLDRLRLDNIHLVVGEYEADIQSLEYNLQPLRLLSGNAVFESLSLAGVKITDNSAAGQAPDLTWPRVPVIASTIGISIKKLDISDISYLFPPGGIELKGLSLHGSVAWRHSRLAVSRLVLKTPYGDVGGEAEAGFYQPTLFFDLDFASRKQVAGMETFSFHGRLKPGSRLEQLSGNVVVAGSGKRVKKMELSGDVGLTGNSFHLRNFLFKREGREDAALSGSVILTAGDPELSLKCLLKDVDLKNETGIATKIRGTVALAGTPHAYRGSFKLENGKEGWQRADVVGRYKGNGRGLSIHSLTAALLDGDAQGTATLDWQTGFALKASLHGKGINPARFNPEWKGLINCDLAGDVHWEDGGRPSGTFKGRLRDSLLHGQLLAGEVKAAFEGGDVNFEKLSLRGDGFTARGSGSFAEKFAFTARIGDLGRLVPESAGKLNMNGHVRYHGKNLSGSAKGTGRKISFGSVRIGKIDFDGYAGSGRDAPLFFNAGAWGIAYGDRHIDSASVKVDGTYLRHGIAASLKIGKNEILASFAGGMNDSLWQGTIESLAGKDDVGPWKLLRPAPLSASFRKIVFGSMTLTGQAAEELSLSGAFSRGTDPEISGAFSAGWKSIDSRRFRKLLPKDIRCGGLISGKMDGKLSPGGKVGMTGQASAAKGTVKWRKGEESLDLVLSAAELVWSGEDITGRVPVLHVDGKAEFKGNFKGAGATVKLRQGNLLFKGSEQGVKLDALMLPEGGGRFNAAFSSDVPLTLALPEKGDMAASWEGIEPGLFRFLMPEAVSVSGLLSGKANGRLLAGRRFFLGGSAELTPSVGAAEGKIGIRQKGGEMNVDFRSASLAWEWRDAALKGELSAALTEYGRMRGSFSLPVAACLPISLDKKGPLQASVEGKFRENGLLTVLLPGLVKESHGELNVNAAIGGSWEKPLAKGTATLSRAGAYLPHAGIDIKDVGFSAQLEDDVIRVASFQAKSGEGIITGKGRVRIAGWRISDFEGELGGNNFQLIYTPELQVRAAPTLTFHGTPQKLQIRGEVKIPELLIYGPPAGNYATPSDDVVMAGRSRKEVKIPLPVFDAKVRLTIGDHARVKMSGIDATLAGALDLEFQNIESIASRGEIRVVNGSYRAYGVSLQITRGRLFYAGGAIDEPSLDILAIRRIDDVKAGVTIGGRLRTPATRLYSDPAMSDVDTLSCIVFGRPLSTRTSAEQIGLLTQVAGLLLTRGKASGFQEQLKTRLGLSTLDIRSGISGLPGSIGYKKVGGSLSQNTSATTQGSDVSETLIAVGKYLTPQLYLSYGRSLFTGNNIFSLRYDITRRWQLETVTGAESGVDLYYRIYFK